MEIWRLATCGHGLHRSNVYYVYWFGGHTSRTPWQPAIWSRRAYQQLHSTNTHEHTPCRPITTIQFHVNLVHRLLTNGRGINHGKTGTSSPEWGDANANCPPDFVRLQNFKQRSKMYWCQFRTKTIQFLANVNSSFSRSLCGIARPSVVCLSVLCNVPAPYSGGSNFRQYFYGIRYLGHPLTSTENFTDIVPGEPLRRES